MAETEDSCARARLRTVLASPLRSLPFSPAISMKFLLAVIACVWACDISGLYAQDATFTFNDGTTTPAGWQLEGGAIIRPADGRSGSGALVLPRAESRAILTVVDPNYVTFFRRPPVAGDDFILEVSSSCAPSLRLPHRPELVEPGPYLMSPVHARYAGSCTVTFALGDYRTGAAVIDDVDVNRLSPDAKAGLEANQRIEAILSRQRYEANLTDAQRRLKTNDSTLVAATQGLAVRVSRTYALEAIQALGSAMALRSAINNPLDYPQFDSVVTKLGTLNRPVQAHTTSLRDAVNGVFGVVKSALQGDLFDAASKLVSTTSVLRGFSDNVRQLLALSSTNDQSQRRLADALRMSRDTADRGIAGVYTRTTDFLERMVRDAEHVDATARKAAELAQRTRQSASQGDSLIVAVLRYAGLPGTPDQLTAYKRAAVSSAERLPGPYPILDTVRTAVTRLVSAAENAAAGEKIASMNELANRLEVYIRAIQQVNTGLDPLVAEQTAFFQGELEYLCNLEPPFTSTGAMQTKWREKAQEAVRALQDAERAFYQAYKFRLPRARACRLLDVS